MSFGFGVGDFLAVLKLANTVRQKWVDAPGEYASLRAEVRNIENILKTLSELAEEVDIDPQQQSDLEDVGAYCSDVLHQADDLANKYSSPRSDKKSVKGRVRRIWKHFKADPDDVRHLRDQLTAAVTQLGVVQNNIEISMEQEIRENVDDLRISAKEQRKLQIADWFSSSNFAEQQSDQLARRHPGTAVWFLENQHYLEWRQGGCKTLFCPGIPGSGKTIMVATAVNNLRQHFNQQEDVLVAYLYCNFRRESEQSFQQMLATLVRQLFQEQTSVPNRVNEIYRAHKDRKTRPSVDELKLLLRLLIQDYGKVFFLVDALDEYANNDKSRDKLLDELFTLQRQPNSNVNLLCTSRFIPEIANRFQDALRIEIVAQKQDVEVYLSDRMPELCVGVRKHKGLHDEIKAKIAAAVDGMFLLARLHFESLQDKMTPKAVQKAIENLQSGPEALQTAYEEAMTRINQQRDGFRQIAQRILTWIVFVRKELSIQELQEAIVIEPNMDAIDHEYDLIDADEMMSVCAGLVTVDQESKVARLVHHTTQEFFQHTKDKWLPDGEALLATYCINYLSMKALTSITELDSMGRDILKTHPVFQHYRLLPYVGQNWGLHAASLNDVNKYVETVLLDQEKLRLVSWLVFHHTNVYESWDPEKASPLHICAFFDDVFAARYLLDNGADVNISFRKIETPLCYAVKYKSMNMVEFLLGQPGIDANRGSPLRRAINAHQLRSVELLLGQPSIDINEDTPLRWATRQRRQDMVKLLLAQPNINVNLGEPLKETARYGLIEIAELLVAQPEIDVNAGLPLQEAIIYGNSKVAGLLLAQPNTDTNKGTMLYWAAREGRTEIVELLLARPGVDVNRSTPTDNYTPLGVACRMQRKEIVKLLLAHPDIDVQKDEPLHWAAEWGDREVVELLLTHTGIDVNCGALKGAAGDGHFEIVELLLRQSGIDINCGALESAARNGYRKIVELLLAQPGIDIGIDPKDLTQIAVDQGCANAIELLLARPELIKPNNELYVSSDEATS